MTALAVIGATAAFAIVAAFTAFFYLTYLTERAR